MTDTLIYLSGSFPLQRVQRAIHMSEVQRAGRLGSTSLQLGHVPSYLLAQSPEPCTLLYHNKSVSPEERVRVTTSSLRPTTRSYLFREHLFAEPKVCDHDMTLSVQ